MKCWFNLCSSKTSIETSDASGYPKFSPEHRSLMARYLTKDLYDELKDLKTSTGFSLQRAIRTGVINPHLGVGIVAGDEESYETFQKIMDLVIEGWHGYKPEDKHQTDLNHTKLTGMDQLDMKYIRSTRVRAGRNIRSFCLPAGASASERLEIQNLLSSALQHTMDGDLIGTYHALQEMSAETEHALQEHHFLFQKPGGGTLLEGAGAARHWPTGRGIFHNEQKNFLVWVNEEDHLRVISMQEGGDIVQVFERWVRGIQAVEKAIEAKGKSFMHNEHLGFISTCPSNLGTSLRASMFVKLENLGQDEDKLKRICSHLGLQPRGSAGEHSASVGGYWDISNKARIGKSEVQLVQTMIDGVAKLIELEKELEGGKDMIDIFRRIGLDESEPEN